MNEQKFLTDYINIYKKALIENNIQKKLIFFKNKLLETKNNKKKVIIAGNGASASISSHVSVDFTKQGRIRTINFSMFIT